MIDTDKNDSIESEPLKDSSNSTGIETSNQELSSQPETPLLAPGAIALMTLLAGPHISIFPGLAVLRRLKSSTGVKLFACLTALLFPVLYAFLFYWPTKWFWSSLILAGAHLFAAICYYLLFRRIYLLNPSGYVTTLPPERLQEKTYTLAGMAGGLFLAPLLGTPFIIAFLLGADKLLLTLLPVAFDDKTALSLLTLCVFGLGISGSIAGGWVGRIRLKLKPLSSILYCLGLVWTSLAWFFFLILLIILPGFLASQANSYMMLMPMTLFVVGNLFIGSWWSGFLLLYGLRPPSPQGRGLRLLSVPGVCLSSAFVFSLLFGYPSSWFHAAGKYFEKQGDVATSRWCYERGLSKDPTGNHASYLQFRIALLAHKLGERRKAISGFRNIVSMYNYDDDLVASANQFLENLEHNVNGRRVVLPGVENPTTYKGAYCVPNSLALVMNFWGAGIEADAIGHQITGLSSGTMIVDQAWFAEQHGFHHQFMPMATIDDITATIDAGFPVMVYVPQHVFVVVGYDETLETLITYDVATRDVWVDYLQKDFLKSWKKENTTMVVVYPPDSQKRLPQSIRTSLAQTSNNYLQYQLHDLQSIIGYAGLDHLQQAANDSSAFFFPLVKMYQEFPSLRQGIATSYDIEMASQEIVNYFSKDFDEGTHLAGQYHDDRNATEDKNLELSISFLIGTRQLQQTRKLIEKIDANGIISNETSESLAMINLAMGNYDRAIPQLIEQNDSQLHFYLAQSYLNKGDISSAIPKLVETVDDCT